jgi:prepilin-type N-terminal cleavage/methylation domain-containing protein/prepilin-type processing-associated H-X9-DG protein
MRKWPKDAFTLIEMLVVVGIFLVLAAALYPALLKAKEWGRTAKCMSNLRQLQVASLNYVTDTERLPASKDYWWLNIDEQWYHRRGWVAWDQWDGWTGTIPDGPRAGGQPSGGAYSWRGAVGAQCITNGALWSYVQRESSIYLCPTFALKTVCGVTDMVRSYSMNSNLSEAVFFNQTVNASRTVLFGDDGALLAGQVDVEFGTNQVGRWHGARGNVVYLDGHAERW